METKEQHLSDFDFELPESLIAQYPLKDRAASRLLHVKPDGSVEDLHFRDILNLLQPGDLLVFNNTKVIKARLNGKKETGGVFEAMTERVTGTYEAISMMRASKAAKPGTILYFDHPEGKEPARAEVLGREGEFFRLKFDRPVLEVLDEYGKVPLPPYIQHAAEKSDESRYQTVYAKYPGAVAAPTAGLHFSRELMKRLEIKGVDFAYITLHAGLGNFRDIDVEDLTKHKMDSEQMFVNEMAVKTVNRAKDNGRNVCAVGTTVMRAIESAVSTDGHLKEFEGWTNKFIFPPYEFTVANSMISNFHMPLSTLLMIVAAFGGYDQVMDAYHVALKEGYRFGTYGDAMLILDK